MNSRPWLLMLVVACTLCGPVRTSISAQSGNTWEGTYSFEENVRRAQGNVGNMSYEIRIYRRNRELVADLDVEGWQTTERLRCDARVEGNKVSLYLRGFGEDDQTGKIKYKVGSLLLTLENSLSGGKQKLLTHWGAFKPIGTANQVSGRSYFRMTATSSEIGTINLEQNYGESRYFLRLFNCDSRCAGSLNDKIIASSGFAQDAGWTELTYLLREGSNRLRFAAYKDSTGGLTYGFQLRKNELMLFEKVCGRAGTIGCENNRLFSTAGVAREFTYEIRLSSSDAGILRGQRATFERMATDAWQQFWIAFRAAVTRRDSNALAALMANPFSEAGNETTPARYLSLRQSETWRSVTRSIIGGTQQSECDDIGGTRVCRVSRDGQLLFAFGDDRKWRWIGTPFKD